MYTEYLENDAEELGSRLWPGALAVSAAWLYVFRAIPRQRGGCSSSASLVEHAHLEMRAGHDAARAVLANAVGDHALALATAEATLRACIDDSFPVWMRLALIEAVEAAFALGDVAKVVELIALVRENFRAGRQPSMDAQILRWEARMAHGTTTTKRPSSRSGRRSTASPRWSVPSGWRWPARARRDAARAGPRRRGA